ncbi:MAG: hypothetical protein IJK14_08770 [Clostridia bacterium]|nr:hypothetical protein [Clostridia bacterium]MBR0445444.1 hypothetical protein [Clostridia bacterium]
MKILSDSLFARMVQEEIDNRKKKERMTFLHQDEDGKMVISRSALTEEDILNAEPITDPEKLERLNKIRKKYGIEIE